MSTPIAMESLAGASPRLKARMAGVFWLLCILTGSFALFAIRGIFVTGDAAATATNLLAHETAYRWGLVANLLATLSYVGATILVYDLCKPVSRNVSLTAAFFSLLGCTGSAIGFFLYLAPLAVLGGSPYLAVFAPEQLQALALLFLRLRAQSEIVTFVFFGLHCFLVGLLILRSTFLPRFVGALMVLAGLGWLTQSFMGLLAPSLARPLNPYFMAAGALGEVSLALWLLVVGVNVQRWKEAASAALGWRPVLPPAADSLAR